MCRRVLPEGVTHAESEPDPAIPNVPALAGHTAEAGSLGYCEAYPVSWAAAGQVMWDGLQSISTSGQPVLPCNVSL